MLFFILFLSIVILQRLVELLIAKRNENVMKKAGAIEFGQEHYPLIVLLHVFFFVSLIIEVKMTGFQLSRFLLVLFGLFVILQGLRVWTIASLGRYWNTKVILLPGGDVVTRGPYRFIRHPNYVIVMLELIVLPLIFNAFITALLFSFLNFLLIRFVRLPVEERALICHSNYKERFSDTRKFTPRSVKGSRLH